MLSEMELNDLNKSVNKELSKVESWLNANKLSLNYSKTKYLLIKPFGMRTVTSDDFKVNIRGIKIDRCFATKYLGVLSDENLSWKPHIEYLQKNYLKVLG